MALLHYLNKIRTITRKLDGCTTEYCTDRYHTAVDRILNCIDFTGKSDHELKCISLSIRESVSKGESLDSVLEKTYSLTCEAIKRVLGISPFYSQILTAIALHEGKIAEMQTGEGKTLSAIFPAILHAFSGKGVHILTFNDYLARRDAQWMKPVFDTLGISVGYVEQGMSISERQQAYNADVTYLTAKESGFDYLRDTQCKDFSKIVHRPFHYAIIDEADSILIDEARVPLVIAGQSNDSSHNEPFMSRLALQLDKNTDFEFDEYGRNIMLTENGIENAQSILGCDNLFDGDNLPTLTALQNALHAHYLLERDKDYIIHNGQIKLIDEFTGRIAVNRRWPDGLQAAVEAKEGCEIKSRGVILNSIPLQHFIALYPHKAGMTATACIAEEEFREFFNLQIVVIPPTKPCIRIDHPDEIFSSKVEKHNAVVKEIIREHKKGRPVLVGTADISESEDIACTLHQIGIHCEILNAKRDEYEAKIIAQAGKPGKVTISTNMAGRGTDIRLGGDNEQLKSQVVQLGGLYVIGTNRHESRRIDNQLRGRAGRQGDPGESRFFISMEDTLFVKYHLEELLPKDTSPTPEETIRKEINRIQRIIEGQNLEIKITLFKYSILLEQQRRLMVDRRDSIVTGFSVFDFFYQNVPDHFELLQQTIDISNT